MMPKPAHLSDGYAAQFSDASIVAAYPHRPPYPPAVFPLLTSLLPQAAGAVLDIGCGTGDIARPLAPLVDRVDAVDISAPMLALGKTLTGGNHPHLRWLLGRAEEVALDPPYGLVTAGESLHWMRWDEILPRLARLLVSGGVLAIADRETVALPWDSALRDLIPRFSTNRDFQPYDIVTELVRRRLFTPQGEARTGPVEDRQSVADYVESFHSRNGFSRDRMTADQAAAFDEELTALVAPFAEGGQVVVRTTGHVRWGLPHAG